MTSRLPDPETISSARKISNLWFGIFISVRAILRIGSSKWIFCLTYTIKCVKCNALFHFLPPDSLSLSLSLSHSPHHFIRLSVRLSIRFACLLLSSSYISFFWRAHSFPLPSPSALSDLHKIITKWKSFESSFSPPLRRKRPLLSFLFFCTISFVLKPQMIFFFFCFVSKLFSQLFFGLDFYDFILALLPPPLLPLLLLFQSSERFFLRSSL